ncbi:dihydrofolate synthase / folylpolyglutamate synthase [Novimethylophilus kurashikiensis]|uniref:Dihydrofolate synthase/folylpolyglutamate synthase n=1 Tax=Novimethylophilus kurashikiensis TaxID=1825523 RepID=A0A2R5FFG5_9PROT|nr:bifunctional tetrahydrofolate synthase/dihydrofolate synthase [Novimethylophilus kurashikiensis]GBG15121.1 dihydrofolate synthase / folylpolyglutamate synthase [Novimethylophilus kurashikiensis]
MMGRAVPWPVPADILAILIPSRSLSEWLSYLESLHPKAIELGLDRVERVRQKLNLSPTFPIITVGGTNGKGSTCAMLEGILTEAGYRVGCYTSPHLLRYNERVRVAGVEVDDASLCQAFAEIELARGDIPLTYFEFGTLAAVWYFMHVGIDVAVLEIGLGGRLDAVNVFDPDCAIITSIDLDHTDYLGTTRESIGNEKAGIFRPGVAAICGDTHPPITVPQRAKEIGARYLQIGHDFGAARAATNWAFWNQGSRIEALPMPALNGDFQFDNACCAIMALNQLEAQLPAVTHDHIRTGLAHVVLTGRFQKLCENPDIFLDVAHNPHAAEGLAENLRKSRRAGGKTLAVFGMLADKDVAGVVEALAGEIDGWFVIGIDNYRGLSAVDLEKVVRAHASDVPVIVCPSMDEALRQACRSAGEGDRIAAFGSFYIVADVLRALPTTGTGSYGC